MFHTSSLKRLSITSYDAVTSPSMGEFASILGDDRGLEYLKTSPRTLGEDQRRHIPHSPFPQTLVIEGKLFRIENFLLVSPIPKKFRLDSRQASLELDACSDSEVTKPYLSFNFRQSIHVRPSRIELSAVYFIVPCDSVTLLETVADTLLFPGLKKPWLDNVNFTAVVEYKSFFEQLSGCIRHRREAGAELESLALRGCNIRVEDLYNLHEIVGKIRATGCACDRRAAGNPHKSVQAQHIGGIDFDNDECMFVD
ncbi:hypothetical protein BDM02DRAFT_3259011 [Thelephora ganbajun]|uniref:Uncharacterized protein n=1 Tax=Thelephora ganbajun TaxID=370292 RepID=A0ACB6ZRD6_THEGA|nr:hypothetical protein BDM02DRAFT_3259011 [Thelephora ganbajun]